MIRARKCSSAREELAVDIVKPTAIYVLSEELVTREIEGELILIPLVSDNNSFGAELFTVSETGKSILDKLDGRKNLYDVVEELSVQFDSSSGELEKDVIKFVAELMNRNLVIEVVDA